MYINVVMKKKTDNLLRLFHILAFELFYHNTFYNNNTALQIQKTAFLTDSRNI